MEEEVIGAHSHEYGWPRHDRKRKHLTGYDSVQTCVICGNERWYSFKDMESGPDIDKAPLGRRMRMAFEVR